jgi:hypothetical protein
MRKDQDHVDAARAPTRRRHVVLGAGGATLAVLVGLGSLAAGTTPKQAAAAPTTSSVLTLSAGQSVDVTCSGNQLTDVPASAVDITESCTGPTTTTTTTPPTTSTTVAPTTTTTAPATTTTTDPTTSPFAAQGLYDGSVSSAVSLGKTLGLNPLKAYSYYCDGSTWSSIGSCGPAGGLPSGTTMYVGLNLSPTGVGDSQAANNLATFRSVATHFVGTPVVFRLGWEFDGNWFSWGKGVNGNTPTSFAFATAQIIPAMKAVDPAAQFDFSDNMGSSSLTQLKAYMGNNQALWNYVGGDHYADKGSTGPGTTSNMTATVTYASQLSKPLSIGEWGLNGTDSPAYVATMCQVITDPAAASAANGWPEYSIGSTSYFNADLSIDSVITNKPNSLAAFRADCG